MEISSADELLREPFVLPLRVYFEDTDAGGVVYHARYLNFFERARTEMLRAAGVSQIELKEKHGLIWVVLEISVQYRQAARLDDELRVTAALQWLKGVRQGFTQDITRTADDAVVATAQLSAAVLNAETLKPVRLPDWIKEKLLNHE
jgi:acyl-CoA thioester hydrolase